MEKSYRTWLNVGPGGRIASVLHCFGDSAPHGHPTLNPDPALDVVLANTGGVGHFVGNDGHVRAKQRVVLRPDRMVALVNETIIVVPEYPDGAHRTRLRIADDVLVLDPGEPLVITWDDVANVLIELDSIEYYALPITLRWTLNG